MPTYEFMCEVCEVVFEEVFIDPEEAKRYQHAHPCSQCDGIAKRIMSSTNFQFKGMPGSSGSHDLDYPTLDKAVGRSAAQKWKDFHEGKEKRDKVRREVGQHAVTQIGDHVSPTSPEKLKLREHVINAFNSAKRSSESNK